MNMKHGNYIVYTILYTDQLKSDFISYYSTYLFCSNINLPQGLDAISFELLPFELLFISTTHVVPRADI